MEPKKKPGQKTRPGFWRTFFDDLLEDQIPVLAASIAYCTTLSLAPLILLALSLIGTLYPSAQERFLAEVGAMVGGEGKMVIREIVESARDRPDLRQLAGWTGAAVLLFGASAIFAQLQTALNRIWNMKNKKLHGVWGFVRRRVLSAGVLLALMFLTIISFVVQGVLATLPSFQEGVLQLVSFGVGLVVYSALFSALYRWLPDGRLPWWTVIRGGILTTLMFMVGRLLIGLYLGSSDTAGAFGAAGTIVVWLIWAYYSAIVFLLSAELLYTLAHHRSWGWWEDTPNKRRNREAMRPAHA